MGLFSTDVTDEVIVSAAFPESNPFGLVVNGESTGLSIQLNNVGNNNYTLVQAAGSYHDPTRDWALVKNVTTLKYNVPLIPGANFSAPFQMYSEFRPQELGLTVWVDVRDSASAMHRITAFNQTVSIVEPASSWFDAQLIFLYLVLVSALTGGAYAAYRALYPESKKKRRGGPAQQQGKAKAVVHADTGKQQYPEVKPYEEEWIPAQHLKSRSSKLKKDGGATSGEELTSGGESGAEGKARRRKAKK